MILSFDIIKSILQIQVEYLPLDKVQTAKSNLTNQSSNSTQIKRTRFRSEDNCHPSFQVQSFQTLILQNDYLSLDKPKAETSRIPETKSFKLKDKLSDQAFKHLGMNRNEDKEKLSTSRRSTGIKSYFKSRNIDTSVEDMFAGSFDLKIDENESNEEDELPKQTQHNNDNSCFNLDKILNKAEKLKNILS